MRVTCSKCGHVREGFREQPSNKITMPSPGDFYLCSVCGELHRFTNRFVVSNRTLGISELLVRPVGDDGLEELAEDHRSMLLQQRAQIRAGTSRKT